MIASAENYRYEQQHENQLIVKLVLFEFFNSFLSLFYFAFWLGDFTELRDQLATLLITRQVLGNLKESIFPFLYKSYVLSDLRSKATQTKGGHLPQGELESHLYPYESTLDDYLEMIVQFGYVTLFSAAFPLAGICALLNNLIEIRSDAFKVTVTCQRPFGGAPCRNIGSWQQVMSVTTYLAVIVNCALLARLGHIEEIIKMIIGLLPVGYINQQSSEQVASAESSSDLECGFSIGTMVLFSCVILEHAMLALKLYIENRYKTQTINNYKINGRTDSDDHSDNSVHASPQHHHNGGPYQSPPQLHND